MDLTNLVNVINTLQSTATSGNVDAGSNTQVGNATTGAVTVLANIINLLASAWSWSNGSLNFFMRTICEINQTCTGDLNLNFSESASGDGGGQVGSGASIANTGADSNNTADVNDGSNLNVNAKNGGNIVNNVDLVAQSGDVSATGNTQVGDVATGDAMVTLNIINLINSFISSGSSFFGILNIFGNFNGDILFPDGFLNGLISSGADGGNSASVSNTGAESQNGAVINNGGQTTINNSSSERSIQYPFTPDASVEASHCNVTVGSPVETDALRLRGVVGGVVSAAQTSPDSTSQPPITTATNTKIPVSL